MKISKRYYRIHKVSVKSDFDLNIPSCFISDKIEKCDLSVESGNSDYFGLDPVAPPYLFYKNGKLVHNYGVPIKCNLSIKDISGDTVVRMTELYRKIPNTKSDEIVDYIIELKLLQKELIKIHGACVRTNGKGVMIVGWDGCGKSTLAYNFLKSGADFLSDDTVIVDRKMAYSYPKPIKVFQGLTKTTRVLNNIPYINKFIGNYKRIFPEKIADSIKIDYVFIVRPGKKKIKEVSAEEAMNSIFTLAVYRMKRRDVKNLVLAYCYYNNYGYDNLIESRRDILKQFLSGVKIYEITSKTPAESMELIEGVLSKNS